MKNICRIYIVFIFFSMNFNINLFAAEKKLTKISIKKGEVVEDPYAKVKKTYQYSYFQFLVGLFKIMEKIEKLRDGTDGAEFYTNPEVPWSELLEYLHTHKDILKTIKDKEDLYIYRRHNIIPEAMNNAVVNGFGIIDDDEIYAKKVKFLISITGGNFNFTDRKEKIVGIVDKVQRFDINAWEPISKFIENFEFLMTRDTELSQSVGKTMKPFIANYYKYMDPITRLKMFSNLMQQYYQMDLSGKEENWNEDLDKLAVKIFQSSGPVFIKLLQQLQEELEGDNSVKKALSSLKKSIPIPYDVVNKLTKNEISKIVHLDKNSLPGYKLQKTLSIASIAQTHFLDYDNERYVIKIQRDDGTLFARESEYMRKMVRNEPEFNKGMILKIENTIEGIEKEINFFNEEQNILLGKVAYTNDELGIKTIDVPAIFQSKPKSSKDKKRILVMTKAPGKTIGDYFDNIKKETPATMQHLYGKITQLFEWFLTVAMRSSGKNFYHGDLHRENVFYEKETDVLTMIDFGNAGPIDPILRDSIKKIIMNVRQTKIDNEVDDPEERMIKVYDAIKNLGKTLQDLVLLYDARSGYSSERRKFMIQTYFKVCFNPNGKGAEEEVAKHHIKEMLKPASNQLSVLKTQLSEIDLNLNRPHTWSQRKGYEQAKLDLIKKSQNIKDDLDFYDSLNKNCLNASLEPLEGKLVSDRYIAEKLKEVFKDMERNGLSLPTDMIFFNKSLDLLTAMIIKFGGTLREHNIPVTKIDLDDLVVNLIEKIE